MTPTEKKLAEIRARQLLEGEGTEDEVFLLVELDKRDVALRRLAEDRETWCVHCVARGPAPISHESHCVVAIASAALGGKGE